MRKRLLFSLLLAAIPSVSMGQALSIRMNSFPNPSAQGQEVTLSAVVTPSGQGVVTFYNGKSVIGSVRLTPKYNASLGVATLPVATNTLSAKFLPDGSQTSLVSNLVQQVVKYGPTIGFTSSQNNAIYGRQITLTAAVGPQGSAPTGKVTFLDGARIIGIGSIVKGVATYSTSMLPPGNRQLVAFYPGDTTHLAGQSDLPQTITALPQDGYQSPTILNLPDTKATYGIANVIADAFVAGGGAEIAAAGKQANLTVIPLVGPAAKTSFNLEYSSPYNIVASDFDGDGATDILLNTSFVRYYLGGQVLVNPNGSYMVLLNRGNNTFKTSESGRKQGASFATADFNSDGIADFAMPFPGPNPGDPELLTLKIGAGNGRFAGSSMDLGGFRPYAIAAADFNGDRKTDLALGSSDGRIRLLLGKGDGTFTPQPDLETAAGIITALAAGDFNQDQRSDLAIFGSQKSVLTLLSETGGTFAPPVSTSLDYPVDTVILMDLNADGFLDLELQVDPDTTTPGQNNELFVMYGIGNGSFQPPISLLSRIEGISVADFNRDGRPDLIAGLVGTPQRLAVVYGKPRNPTPTLTATPPNPSYSDTIIFSVDMGSVVPAPTGQVALLRGSTPIANANLDDKGKASINYAASLLGPSPAELRVRYEGDSVYPAGYSPTVTITVSPVILLTISPNPASVGQSVTFTATSAPAELTGEVVVWEYNPACSNPAPSLRVAPTAIGMGQLVNGRFTVTTSGLGVGTYEVCAMYFGTPNLTSPTIALTVTSN